MTHLRTIWPSTHLTPYPPMPHLTQHPVSWPTPCNHDPTLTLTQISHFQIWPTYDSSDLTFSNLTYGGYSYISHVWGWVHWVGWSKWGKNLYFPCVACHPIKEVWAFGTQCLYTVNRYPLNLTSLFRKVLSWHIKAATIKRCCLLNIVSDFNSCF